MSGKLASVEQERDILAGKNREQADRIKQLEEILAGKNVALSESEKKAAELAKSVEKLTVEASQAEILRFNYVRQLVPTVVKRLQTSEEYQVAWAEAFNAAIDAGWLKGVKCGRTDEQVEAIIASSQGFDLQVALNFEASYDEMFTRQFPYVEKVASSYRLPLADIMNIVPASEEITPGAGASGTAPFSDEAPNP